jgi:hypothetical protein
MLLPNLGMLDPVPGFCADSVASREPSFDVTEDGFAGSVISFVVTRFVSLFTVFEASPSAVFDAVGDAVVGTADILPKSDLWGFFVVFETALIPVASAWWEDFADPVVVDEFDNFLGFRPPSLPLICLRVRPRRGGRSLSKSMEGIEDNRDELLGGSTVISGIVGAFDAFDFSIVGFENAKSPATELSSRGECFP